MSKDNTFLFQQTQGRRNPQTQHSMASALLTLVQKHVQAPGSTGAGAGAGALATGGGGGGGRGRFVGGGGASSAGGAITLPRVISGR